MQGGFHVESTVALAQQVSNVVSLHLGGQNQVGQLIKSAVTTGKLLTRQLAYF